MPLLYRNVCTSAQKLSLRCSGDDAELLHCVTELPGFDEVCLNRWVFLKTKNRKRYTTLLNQGRASENEFFRAVSYRQFIRFVWGYTGKSQRYPLPCCRYSKDVYSNR